MDVEKQARAAGLERQQAQLAGALRQLDGLDHKFFVARLIVVVGGFVTSFAALSFAPGAVGVGVTVVAVLLFGGVVWLHRRVDRRQRWLGLQSELAARQLARLRLDWGGIPMPPAIPLDPAHPFAGDLNLFGEHSLHQVLDTATSRGGSRRLAGWLLEPRLNAGHIRGRQAILRELIPLSGFRRGLALQGMGIKAELKDYWDGEKLLSWLEGGTTPRSLVPVLTLLFILAGINIVLFGLFTAGVLPAYWAASLAIYTAVYLSRFSDYKEIFENAYDLGKSLDQFRAILVYLEDYPYPKGSALAGVCAPFLQAERRPSRYLKGIVALTSATSLGNNPMLALLFNTVIPWNLLFAYLLGRYRASLRAVLPGWLDTWYELEALVSLANFGYLNPATIFPEILEGAPGAAQPLFETHGLGHPLIAEETRVVNDFALRHAGEVAIVTGSNMSGKSTFLRTLGVNLCLALAGGPVAASQFRTRLVRLFTCIQVNDSLADGISYFYAEVRRLKALLVGLDSDDPHPLFFLIDEIFRGTNNRERQIGSQAYVRALAQGRGAGLISTHDLELVKLSEIGYDIHNYHFREEIRDGRMAFDYRLRPGPCPTTNALKIMALEGLPVEAGTGQAATSPGPAAGS